MFVFLVFVIAVGWVFAQAMGSPIILYIAVIIAFIMNVGSYWYSDKVVLALSHAVPADRNQYLDLYQVVENLSITAGLPTPRVYIVNDPSPNAFATGRDKNHAVVVVTTGLLKILDRSELEGVIAHELSHIGNRDILLSTIVAVLVGFISILANIFMRGGVSRNRDSNSKGGGVIMLIGIILVILSPVIAKLIQLAISRKREFLADASGVLLTRYPEGLANALKKIELANIPLQHNYTATAHLYISNPLAGVGKKMATLFSTHPATADRIQAILNTSKSNDQY